MSRCIAARLAESMRYIRERRVLPDSERQVMATGKALSYGPHCPTCVRESKRRCLLDTEKFASDPLDFLAPHATFSSFTGQSPGQ